MTLPRHDHPALGASPSAGLAGSPRPQSGGYPIPAEQAFHEVSFRDIWYRLVRQRWLIATSFTIGMSAAAGYALRAVPIYQAATSIRIDERRSSVAMSDALSGLGGGNELATEMEVLRSRSLAETVVHGLSYQVQITKPRGATRDALLTVHGVADTAAPAEFILQRHGSGFRIVGGSGLLIGPGEPVRLGAARISLTPAVVELTEIHVTVKPFRTAVEELRRGLAVTRPSVDANVVGVRFQGTDPGLVREVPNMLSRNFIVARNAVKKTESRSTIEFLRTQIDKLAHQLTAAEDSLRDFREHAGIVSLPAEASSQVQRLATLEAERAGLDAERTALAAMLAEVDATTAGGREQEPSPYRRLLALPSLLRSAAFSQLLGTLASIDDERMALLARRTTRDPDVIALSERAHDAEQEIRVLATTYMQGLVTQIASIDDELTRFNSRLKQVPAKELEYARRVRQPEVLEGIYTMLQGRLKEAEIAQAVEDPSVRVVDPAISPKKPIEPNKLAIVLAGGALGLFAGVAGGLIRGGLDSRIRSRDDVLRITGLPVLGIIPRMAVAIEGRHFLAASLLRRVAFSGPGEGSGSAVVRKVGGDAAPAGTPRFASRAIAENDPRNPVSEAYRTLRTNITFVRLDSTPKTIVFASPMPGDGKSTTSANLAIALGQQGLRVLLVDADLRRGVLNQVFHRPRSPGVSNLIVGGVELAEAIHTIPLSDGGAIDFLPTGPLPPNPAEVVGSRRMGELLSRLEDAYDMIILDTPPLNLVTDAALLGTKADGVVVVTRAGTTCAQDLEYAMLQLCNVRAPVLGVVLNGVDVSAGHRYGYAGAGSHHYYKPETATA